MNRTLQMVLIAVLVIISISAASAQYKDDGPSKFSLKLMSFVPLDGDLKDVGAMWTGVGVDYHLKLDEDGKPTSLTTLRIVGADKNGLDVSSNSLSYTKLHRVPISAERAKYSGYGVGIYNLKLEFPGSSDSTYKPGLHAVFGQELKDSYFAELRFDYVTEWKSKEWGGISLNLGARM